MVGHDHECVGFDAVEMVESPAPLGFHDDPKIVQFHPAAVRVAQVFHHP